MCDRNTGSMEGAKPSIPEPSEVELADLLAADLGITVNPQALRMFLRARWDRVKILAHRIHEGKS